jgi:zona occludens toxin
MISIYSGSVGSGKSFHGTHIGLEWLNNRHVIANFPILPPKKLRSKMAKKRWADQEQRWHFNDEITIQYLIAKSLEHGWIGKESQCLLLIDEAGIIFNSRDWQSAGKQREHWIKFLSQSRKFGYDVIFIAQSDRMIDKQIRGLVEYDVKHLKLNHSFFLSWLSLLKVSLFLYNYKWYQTKLKGNMRVALFQKKIAERYDTMRTFNLEELAEQVEKLYEGVIVPASVAIQIDLWRDEIEKRRKTKVRPGFKDVAEGSGVPSPGLEAIAK